MAPSWVRRALVVTAVGLLGLLPVTPALADPAGPTNYRTTITSVTPSVGSQAEIEVFGGDSFLVLTLAPGVDALVYGYAHDPVAGVLDPYLRFNADGTVEVNRRSPSRWLNEDRYAATVPPDGVDPAAPPEWEPVGQGGSYAWHDHRIHWMSPALPQTIDPQGGVQRVFPEDQVVPMQIAGVEVAVAISLSWEPSSSAIPWQLAALVLAAVLAVAAQRGRTVVAVGLVVASMAALAVGAGAAIGLPAGVGWALPPILLPAVSLGLVAVALTREDDLRRLLLLGAGLPLLAWVATQWGALDRPIVPSAVPVVVIRVAASLAAAAGVGAILTSLLGVFSSDLSSLADLADDGDAVEGRPASG